MDQKMSLLIGLAECWSKVDGLEQRLEKLPQPLDVQHSQTFENFWEIFICLSKQIFELRS